MIFIVVPILAALAVYVAWNNSSSGNYTGKSKKGNIIKFNSQPIASGSFRYCFLGDIISGPNKGEKGVVKTFKIQAYRNSKQQAQKQIKASQFAAKKAWDYNQELRRLKIDASVTFPTVDLVQINEVNSQNKKYFKVGDWVCLQKNLQGYYQKWSNNYNYFQNSEEILSTFTHFTYQQSNYTSLCCDLQGIKMRQLIYFTDPAINSCRGEFGGADCGSKGINSIMSLHKCNKICKMMRLSEVTFFLNLRYYYYQIVSIFRRGKGTVFRNLTGI